MFAACAANRDSDPELAGVIPDWGAASTFDGEDVPAIVASVFGAPGDAVQADPSPCRQSSFCKALLASGGMEDSCQLGCLLPVGSMLTD
jgi:hypothetical protein